MIYLRDVSQIDKKIEAFNAHNLSIDKKTKYIVMHSQKNLVAPLKEIICNGHKDSSVYKRSNGNAAFLHALKLGYVCSEDDWDNGAVVKTDYPFLHNRNYILLKFIPSSRIGKIYLNYINAEQALRTLLGRPNERNEPLGQFGEFLYCKLFGASANKKLNVSGYDLIDPVTNQKIQIKVARKAGSNKAGIQVCKLGDFDLLAIFWLGKDRKVTKFFEISKKELMDIAKGKRGIKDTVDIKISDLTKNQIIRSMKKVNKAIKFHKLEDIFDLNNGV